MDPDTRQRPSDSRRVLVVDDEPGLADLVGEQLTRIDDSLSVDTATGGQAALNTVRETEYAYDCLVSDYNMPDLNGLELCHAVQEVDSDLPFILYTGRGSEEIASEAISAGVTDYIQKESGSDHYQVLANSVENAIAQRRANEQLQQTNEKIHALHGTASKAATCDTRAELCELAVEAAEDILDFDLCAIDLEEDGELVPFAVSDGAPTDDIYCAVSIPNAETLDAMAYRREETVLVNDVHECDHVPTETEYRSALTIPIEDHGIFQAVSRSAHGFDDRDRELAELLVTHVAAELDNMETRTKLRVERDKFATLFRNIPHAIGIGLFEDGAPVVSEVNPTFEETFGIDSEDICGDVIDSHIVPTDRRAEATQLNDRMRNGEEVSGAEIQRLAVDGMRDFLLHSVNLPTSNIGGIVVYTDITDLKRRERELERKNRRLEYFTRVVSHDLRNPLRVARSALELERETTESDHLDTAVRAHDRIEELIDDVLTLARGGQAVQEPQPLDLQDVVADCWETVATADSKLVTETTRSLRGDPSRVKQLFENLFRNAVDHAGESVTITVGDLDGENGFYVEDDGPGIPQADRDDVFDPGYTTTGDGTGFGLAIVNEIADAHGWTIAISDGEDEGTRFEITGIKQAQTPTLQS